MKKYLMNNKRWEIKFGNIFKEKGLKVIPCNEYFDTLVDEKIVSSKTLHGMFLNRYLDKNCFNEIIKVKFNKDNFVDDKNGQDNCKYDIRKISNKLGTIVKYKDFILVAFSKFDQNEKAYLTSEDYDKCMKTMWENILKHCANSKIVLPIMGAGVTNLDFIDNKDNIHSYYCTLIEKMIKPLKELNANDLGFKIVLHESLKGKINLR